MVPNGCEKASAERYRAWNGGPTFRSGSHEQVGVRVVCRARECGPPKRARRSNAATCAARWLLSRPPPAGGSVSSPTQCTQNAPWTRSGESNRMPTRARSGSWSCPTTCICSCKCLATRGALSQPEGRATGRRRPRDPRGGIERRGGSRTAPTSVRCNSLRRMIGAFKLSPRRCRRCHQHTGYDVRPQAPPPPVNSVEGVRLLSGWGVLRHGRRAGPVVSVWQCSRRCNPAERHGAVGKGFVGMAGRAISLRDVGRIRCDAEPSTRHCRHRRSG